MNANAEKGDDSLRNLLLLEELERSEGVSQRELARRLGIAVGLVNSYLKNMVAKGYVRIASFPRNRYAYLLTPQGIAEKSRLVYQHLSWFTSLYRTAREDYSALFRDFERQGIARVVFCGVDEAAEIALLSLKETGVELAAMLDDTRCGESFFGVTVTPLCEWQFGPEPVVITSIKRREELKRQLDLLGTATTVRHYTAGDPGIHIPEAS